MKRQVILIRFGETPNPAITMALVPHMQGKAIALPVPGAILSVFDSESKLEDIRASLKEIGDPYFFLFEKNNSQFNLPEVISEIVQREFGDFQTQAPAPVKEWTVDEVLDLIAAHGIESLTPDQKAVLERGSN